MRKLGRADFRQKFSFFDPKAYKAYVERAEAETEKGEADLSFFVYAKIRKPGRTDFRQKFSFFDPKAYKRTSRGRKRK